MAVLILTLILLYLFYFIGKLIYFNKEKHFSIIKVLSNFFVLLFGNALIMLFLLVILISTLLFLGYYFEDGDLTLGKFPTGQFLLIVLIFILITAIIHFIIRYKYFIKIKPLKLDLEEYELIEYFIQWMTIYIVVYQFLFDGFSSLVSIIPEMQNDYKTLFSVFLSPNNINLILQPLLISTWIVVVMEKIKLRNKLERE